MLGEKMLQFALLGAEWVLWLLVGLSVLCVGIAIERAFYFATRLSPAAPFQAALGRFLSGGTSAELESQLTAMKGMEAKVMLAGLGAARAGYRPEEAMSGTIAFERLGLERWLLIIGTVASNAPYIGLFGTVLGIMKAFHDLANMQSQDTAAAVMSGISEALVSTAVGLLVAIPSVMLYNYFTRRIKDVVGRAESLGQLVLSRIATPEG